MRATFLLAGVLLLSGCRPSVETCRAVLPVSGDPVIVTTTPAGDIGCSCVTDGVTVMVQPVRDGLFGWKRGQIWIDGTAVAEADFATKLDDAKTRKRAEEAAEKLKSAAERAVDKAQALAKGVMDAIKKK